MTDEYPGAKSYRMLNCEYDPRACDLGPAWYEPDRILSLTLLDCWQREYDKRPYKNFWFNRLDLESRLRREYDYVRDFARIVEFINERNIKTLHIIGVTVYVFPKDILEEFAKSLFKLEHIEFINMVLPNRFFEALYEHGTIMTAHTLSFEGTTLNGEAIEALRKFIIRNVSIHELNMNRCNITQFDFPLLVDALHKSKSIRIFRCSRLTGGFLSLDTYRIAHLMAQLIWQNCLEELEMQQCEFHARDIELWCEYLARKNSKLRKLNLACNILSCLGTEILLRTIIESNTLTHLNIASNNIGTHGGDVVMHLLSSCDSLEHLDISKNNIGAETTCNILTCMKKRIKLTRLVMWGNHFNLKGANVLRRLLKARVVRQDAIDLTVIFDITFQEDRIIQYFE